MPVDEGMASDRIALFREENQIEARLMEASELQAALGGVYLKLDVMPGVVGVPVLSVRSPQGAIPTFTAGRLTGITFWRVVESSEAESRVMRVMRLFEHREMAVDGMQVQYALYEGTFHTVGKRVDYDRTAETQRMADAGGLVDMLYPRMDGLGVVYVPNMLPNRMDVSSFEGLSDYHAVISLLDSLDAAWTSWIRDLELGLGRAFVDEELLEGTDVFSPHQRGFIKSSFDSWRIESAAKPIEVVQFEIRVEEHMQTCASLVQEIVSRCGYSPQTFGLNIDGRAESGTALRVREQKSQTTRQKKARYWQPALRSLLWQAQQIEIIAGLSPRYEPTDVSVKIQDSITTDPREQSETIRNLRQAEAVSIETSVRMMHPDWSDEAVADEMERITKERGTYTNPMMEGV